MHASNVAHMQHVTYTRSMAEETAVVPALGMYLQTLRLRSNLSQAEVLRRYKDLCKVEINRSTLRRAESGKAWPESDILIGILGVVGGTLEDLVWIRQNPYADDLDSINRAEEWIRKYGKAESAEEVIQANSQDDAAELADELEALAKRVRAGRG